MNDERALERRIAWLERKVVRVLWTIIGIISFMAGFFTYRAAVEPSEGLIAFGCAAAVWLTVGWYLHRLEFKGAPEHIEFIDP
jgi:hypothetical protein